jgi:hypothetical protein
MLAKTPRFIPPGGRIENDTGPHPVILKSHPVIGEEIRQQSRRGLEHGISGRPLTSRMIAISLMAESRA